MFGPDDTFLTTVARLLRILPVYPMFGWGQTKLQPVYVEDVAEGVARVLAGAGGDAASYEFVGPRVYTYQELVRIVADRIKIRPRLVPLPFALLASSCRGGRVPPRPSHYPQSGSTHAARQHRFRRSSRFIEPGHRADGSRNARNCSHGPDLRGAIRGRLPAPPPEPMVSRRRQPRAIVGENRSRHWLGRFADRHKAEPPLRILGDLKPAQPSPNTLPSPAWSAGRGGASGSRNDQHRASLF
jgi:hypothetical protein